jgi:23S rRNA pseudouridine955/2504/2580 synthase
LKQTVIRPADANRRLDKYLLSYMNTAGKNFIYKMLRKKRIKLNGGRASGSEILKEGDVITYYISDETQSSFMEAKALTARDPRIDALYEDGNILVVNKPVNLLTHSDPAGDALIDRALLYLHQKGEYDADPDATFTPAACNRLDRNTSGIVLIGKTLAAVQALNGALRSGDSLEKYYLAIVTGELEGSAILEGFLEKDGRTNTAKIRADAPCPTPPGALKQVVTHYETLKTTGKYSLLKIKLVTGRPHQIRAHMKAIGHPIVGDRKYAGANPQRGFDSQLLHAAEIRFRDNNLLGYLNGRTFSCEPPAQFKDAMGLLGLR